MSEQETHTVAIVEDNPALAQSMRKVIESSPGLECVGVWSSGEEALKKIDAFHPDVVLMDIHMPGISGIEATAKLREMLPEVQVIMVTVYGDHDKIFAALEAGASGYLLKRSTPAEIREAIRDVLTGGAPMSPEIARRVVERFRKPKREHAEETSLSRRETQVLELVCDGMTNKEINDKLGISFDTVRAHLRNIYDKLHVRSRTEAAMKFREFRGK